MKWEYKLLVFEDLGTGNDLQGRLCLEGKSRWELVQMLNREPKVLFVFKRWLTPEPCVADKVKR